MNTFCSRVADSKDIAVHRRKISGDARGSVVDINVSIQEVSLRDIPLAPSQGRLVHYGFDHVTYRLTFAGIVTLICLQSVGISSGMKVGFVPTDFDVVGDAQIAAAL